MSDVKTGSTHERPFTNLEIKLSGCFARLCRLTGAPSQQESFTINRKPRSDDQMVAASLDYLLLAVFNT
jgi:hypothetical protein